MPANGTAAQQRRLLAVWHLAFSKDSKACYLCHKLYKSNQLLTNKLCPITFLSKKNPFILKNNSRKLGIKDYWKISSIIVELAHAKADILIQINNDNRLRCITTKTIFLILALQQPWVLCTAIF